MAGRIVLFGATGYTGRLAARAMVARGAAPVLAARSRERVEALAAELGGLDCAVADVMQPQSIRSLLEPGDVLVSTVGPFLRWGGPALDAALDAGAHYVDSTGESPFIRAVFEERAAAAEAAGVGLLTAFGYDYVPGNLAGALVLREAGERAVSVDVGYFVGGGARPSGGTRASAAGMLAAPAYAFRDGRLVTERTARDVRRFDGRPAVSIGATEQFALPRVHPGLRQDLVAFVGIAGANRGTSFCPPGTEGRVVSCDEIAAGTPWLARLNAAGETYGPARWMTVYDGTGAGDPAFTGPTYAQSPRLAGADNRQ
ncbi:MAG: saccharopine dehydrogenase NADP-binding domain-containing protein, partial [Actinobacteria bacterium]|nr:saccharopine dehydrogenase NADP-binding domain-containing protein [Actinomycetota bacterium]